MKFFTVIICFLSTTASAYNLNKLGEIEISNKVGMHYRSLSTLETKAGEKKVIMALNEVTDSLDKSVSFIYTSADNGVTWEKSKISKESDNYFAIEFSTSTLSGEIFWTGFTYDRAKKRYASIISRSTDSGKTWNIIDKYDLGIVSAASLQVLDLAGSVKRIGKSTLLSIQTLNDALGASYWITRKSVDNGANWSTTDVLFGAGNDDSNPTSITVTDKGNIFVTGWWVSEEANTSGFTLTTRKSIDNGNSWTFSDVFTPKPLIAGKAANATGDLIASGGKFIYAFSRARFGDGKRDCLIRKSSDEGETWISVDRFTPGVGKSCIYHEAHITKDGSLIAIAQDRSKEGTRNSHIRLFNAKTNKWSSIELPEKNVTMPDIVKVSEGKFIIGLSVRSVDADPRNRVILYNLTF